MSAPPSYNAAAGYPQQPYPAGGYIQQGAGYPAQYPAPVHAAYPGNYGGNYGGQYGQPYGQYQGQEENTPTVDEQAPMVQPPVRVGPTTGVRRGMIEQPALHQDESEAYGNEWAGTSFADKSIRRTFIRKVYMILTVQLSVTVGFISFFLFHLPTRRWIRTDGFWCYYLSYATFLATYITLVCCPSVRRKYPGNFICLAIFTLAFSYLTGTITSFYQTESVLIAAGITTLVTFSVSIFAMQTKFDFTKCGAALFVASLVFMFFGIAVWIVYAFWGYSYILQVVYGAIGALLFSLFLAYDTQMLMGKHKLALSPEEHIFGALQLYVDIVYIFILILSLFGGGGRGEG